MKKTKHSEETIIAAVKQVEAGRSVKELARELGVTDQTLYNWKSKFGGMDVSDAKRLKALEDENRRLKSLVADLCLDKELTTVIRKNGWSFVSARRDVALLMTEHGLGERHACRLLELDRSTYRYEPRPDRNAKLREALLLLARKQPRYGYRRLWALLMQQGWEVDVKRVYRLYKAEGLMVRRSKRKRLARTAAVNPLLVRPNQGWAMDFVSDALTTGRALRTFTQIDSYTKESLAIEVNTGISSHQVNQGAGTGDRRTWRAKFYPLRQRS